MTARTVTVTTKMVACDWHYCDGQMATAKVRHDVQHEGGGFTSLYWTRCDAHTPPNREGTYISRDGRGWPA